MRTPLKIILLGLPGSGKSTFGRLIARKLNFAFVDLDQVIETETGKKSGKYFKKRAKESSGNSKANIWKRY
jgi:shikimate kinase